MAVSEVSFPDRTSLACSHQKIWAIKLCENWSAWYHGLIFFFISFRADLFVHVYRSFCYEWKEWARARDAHIFWWVVGLYTFFANWGLFCLWAYNCEGWMGCHQRWAHWESFLAKHRPVSSHLPFLLPYLWRKYFSSWYSNGSWHLAHF
jgi:hypothetical protein